MRQKTQSVTTVLPDGAAIIRRSSNRFDEKESPNGHVSEVQTAHPQERQPREAGRHVVSQDLSRASRKEVLSRTRAVPLTPAICDVATGTAPRPARVA